MIPFCNTECANLKSFLRREDPITKFYFLLFFLPSEKRPHSLIVFKDKCLISSESFLVKPINKSWATLSSGIISLQRIKKRILQINLRKFFSNKLSGHIYLYG